MRSSQHPASQQEDAARPFAALDASGGLDGLDGLITQTRRLRDAAEAARDSEQARDEGQGVRRAVWDLAMTRLADVAALLDQLRSVAAPDGRGHLAARTGSAEWNLLTDAVRWSEETFTVFGRTADNGPLTLDELPSCLPPADRPVLTAAVTTCLVDGRPMDCEFRVVRPDGSLRTVQLAGEPVLDCQGGTVAMRAVVRDVSGLRHGETPPAGVAPAGSGEPRRQVRAVEPASDAGEPWLRASERGGVPAAPGGLELAVRHLPGGATAVGGPWHDAVALPGGGQLLSMGDLSGQDPAAAAAAAGAIRGIALMGAAPGQVLGLLGELLSQGSYPVLGSAVCGRFERAPGGDSGHLTWAQAGHPAPLLWRDGSGRALPRPAGTLLGAVPGAAYGQRTDRLVPGDVLVLHTDGLLPGIPREGPADHRLPERLAALAPRIAAAGSAAACLELIADACGGPGREENACLLVARVVP